MSLYVQIVFFHWLVLVNSFKLLLYIPYQVHTFCIFTFSLIFSLFLCSLKSLFCLLRHLEAKKSDMFDRVSGDLRHNRKVNIRVAVHLSGGQKQLQWNVRSSLWDCFLGSN